MYITPRSLLGIIRTAQAHAKIRFSDKVEKEDIDEALRLLDSCRNSFDNEKDKAQGISRAQDSSSEIYKIITQLARKTLDGSSLKYASGSEISAEVMKRGYTNEQFFACLDQYQKLNTIYVSREDETITLI